MPGDPSQASAGFESDSDVAAPHGPENDRPDSAEIWDEASMPAFWRLTDDLVAIRARALRTTEDVLRASTNLLAAVVDQAMQAFAAARLEALAAPTPGSIEAQPSPDARRARSFTHAHVYAVYRDTLLAGHNQPAGEMWRLPENARQPLANEADCLATMTLGWNRAGELIERGGSDKITSKGEGSMTSANGAGHEGAAGAGLAPGAEERVVVYEELVDDPRLPGEAGAPAEPDVSASAADRRSDESGGDGGNVAAMTSVDEKDEHGASQADELADGAADAPGEDEHHDETDVDADPEEETNEVGAEADDAIEDDGPDGNGGTYWHRDVGLIDDDPNSEATKAAVMAAIHALEEEATARGQHFELRAVEPAEDHYVIRGSMVDVEPEPAPATQTTDDAEHAGEETTPAAVASPEDAPHLRDLDNPDLDDVELEGELRPLVASDEAEQVAIDFIEAQIAGGLPAITAAIAHFTEREGRVPTTAEVAAQMQIDAQARQARLEQHHARLLERAAAVAELGAGLDHEADTHADEARAQAERASELREQMAELQRQLDAAEAEARRHSDLASSKRGAASGYKSRAAAVQGKYGPSTPAAAPEA